MFSTAPVKKRSKDSSTNELWESVIEKSFETTLCIITVAKLRRISLVYLFSEKPRDR